MRNLIVIIFLLTAISVSAQSSYTTDKIWRNPLETEWNQIEQISEDTCVKYVGRLEGAKWICTDTIYFLCDTLNQGQAGGFKGSDTIPNEQKEFEYFVNELKKIDAQIQELQKAREQILGVVLYLQRKFNFEVK